MSEASAAEDTPKAHAVWWSAFSNQLRELGRALPEDCEGAIQFLIREVDGGIAPYFLEIQGRRISTGRGLCGRARARVRLPEAEIAAMMLGEARRTNLTLSGDLGLLDSLFAALAQAAPRTYVQLRSESCRS